ncbi:conserved hypothetical protein, partial [Ixodes scapularis]
IEGGIYSHYGLAEGIKHTLSLHPSASLLENVELLLNIDGVSLSVSSKSCLWPIMCSVADIPNSVPFIVGCYHGYSKPNSVDEYLSELIPELEELLENGLIINGRTLRISLKAFVCDAPARAFLLGIKSHTGYSCCGKCKVRGEYIKGRVSLRGVLHEPRTNDDFRRKKDSTHNISDTPLVKLPLDMVVQFPFEYMHLVCLGVTRKLIILWIRGHLECRITPSTMKHVSASLKALAGFIPCEFARRPRALEEIDRWKATELRQFLLYTGPVVLSSVLDKKYFQHFLLLHVSLRLLVGAKTCAQSQLRSYAGALLKRFVRFFGDLYGDEQYSYNVHGLLHLVDDSATFGSLDNVSAFQFENYFHRMKGFISQGNLPLQQLSRRLHEMKENGTLGGRSSVREAQATGTYVLTDEHTDGPVFLPPSAQFRKATFSGFTLASKTYNNVCIISGSVVQVQNIVKDNDGCNMVIGQKFENKRSLYEFPCSSTKMDVYAVSGLSDTMQWPLESVACKCVLLPLKQNSFAVLPLIHSNEFPDNEDL